MIARLTLHGIGLMAGLLASAPGLAQFVRLNQPFLFPQLSGLRDEHYIVFVDNCGEGRLHEPVVLRQGAGDTWTLEGRLVATQPTVCFAVPGGPGSAVHAVRIRPQELMTSSLRVDIDGLESTAYEGEVPIIGMGTLVPPSIDGAWHDPSNPGQGLYLAQTRSPGRLSVVALLATYDEGKPLWLTGIGSNDGAYRVKISLYRTSSGAFPTRGTSPPSVQAWGELELEYLGCHRIRANWRALDAAAFPDGSREFRQFTPDMTHECDIHAFAQTVAQEVFIYEPTVLRLP